MLASAGFGLALFRRPVDSPRLEIQLKVHCFFQRLQFEQELKALSCLSF